MTHKTVYQASYGKMSEKSILIDRNLEGWFDTKEIASFEYNNSEIIKNNKILLFKRALKQLLEEHNATLEFNYDEISGESLIGQTMDVEITHGENKYLSAISPRSSIEAKDIFRF